MKKEPKGRFSLIGGLKFILYAEIAAAGTSYFVWYKMNRSQDFRWKMHKYFPALLNGYYWMEEKYGDFPIKLIDYKTWGIQPPGK